MSDFSLKVAADIDKQIEKAVKAEQKRILADLKTHLADCTANDGIDKGQLKTIKTTLAVASDIVKNS